MRWAEYLERTSLSKEELLAIGRGTLLEDAPGETAKLPLPPMLMFDRVTSIERRGPRGRIVAELDVRLDAWYFLCHFAGDPVQPGCLGLDAVWQLIGLYLSSTGNVGTGRALGVREVEFAGQIRPHDRLVRYDVEVARVLRMHEAGAALALADATVAVDGEVIYTIRGAKVGIYQGITYPDYPARSKNSRGGVLRLGGESAP